MQRSPIENSVFGQCYQGKAIKQLRPVKTDALLPASHQFSLEHDLNVHNHPYIPSPCSLDPTLRRVIIMVFQNYFVAKQHFQEAFNPALLSLQFQVLPKNINSLFSEVVPFLRLDQQPRLLGPNLIFNFDLYYFQILDVTLFEYTRIKGTSHFRLFSGQGRELFVLSDMIILLLLVGQI